MMATELFWAPAFIAEARDRVGSDREGACRLSEQERTESAFHETLSLGRCNSACVLRKRST